VKKLNILDWVAMVLVIVGGLNWGLVGIFKLDLVKAIFGGIPSLQMIVYVLVGLAAVYLAVIASKLGKQGE
jgi:uncharacterized protein